MLYCFLLCRSEDSLNNPVPCELLEAVVARMEIALKSAILRETGGVFVSLNVFTLGMGAKK